MEPRDFAVDFAGKDLTISVGKFANRASSAVTVSMGDTVVLVTAVVANEPREGVDFFPLMVDYEERLYATGKISGSRFIKREGRPSDNAILNARLIDRPIRPLFPKGFRNDIQIVCTVLSVGKNDPDIPAMVGASAALMLTHAPYKGPIAGIRIGLIDGEFVFNPTIEEQDSSELDLVVSGNRERILMLEAGAKQLPEAKVIEAIKLGHEKMQPLFDLQEQIQKEMRPQFDAAHDEDIEILGSELHLELKEKVGSKIAAAVRELEQEKRSEQLKQYETEVLSAFEGNYKQVDIKSTFGQLVEKEVRQAILNDGIRPDGRKTDEIRDLSSEVSLLPRTHGSALFSRGETQVLSIVTLAGPGMEQLIDTMEEESQKRFMHHYNFPPFSVGEVKPMRSTSRREIGHGALAERAVEAVIPKQEDFPYTIRVVSEVLSSNGSSSMASTCGTVLALMDAGVPIAAPVAGIAVGLMTEEGFNEDATKKYQLLTDIQGIEDFGGDMDFKVTGTEQGVTAIQLDMKVHGLPIEIVEETFAKARAGRLHVLENMKTALTEPRTELSQYAPRIISFKIPEDKIGDVIGPGGKVIKSIVEAAGGKAVTTIDIEEDGTVAVASIDADKGQQAAETIKGLIADVEVGQVYEGEVISIQKNRMSGQEIGAIVQVLPNKEGMVHISEISKERVPDVSSQVKVGQKVKVKVLTVDKDRGRVALSIKQAE
ncbi:polyribonucleotide nucleotidyltransferase [Candidatus Berkelbacteria bacterium]|nr:polyribonucleotide nucleotidyltransferase [Candidatus Berkelbacteria bacterium]